MGPSQRISDGNAEFALITRDGGRDLGLAFGRDLRDLLAQELAPVARERVANELDPAGVLNPGVLID